ncbi:MAG: hypothetical protein AAGE13_08460, partial [Pseudomonadota bacterium]
MRATPHRRHRLLVALLGRQFGVARNLRRLRVRGQIAALGRKRDIRVLRGGLRVGDGRRRRAVGGQGGLNLLDIGGQLIALLAQLGELVAQRHKLGAGVDQRV